jgi:dipeptidase
MAYLVHLDNFGVGVDELLVEGGEALTVIDPNEAWMFHIIPDDTGASAVWVAQRVPDDHISIVANGFVIREVDPNNEDFMFSANMWDVAHRKGWWSESDGLLDFKTTFGAVRSRPNYSNRRVWRILSLAAPSANLPADVDPEGDELPFSVKVDSKLAPADLMRYQRDHFEGTPYSTTEGLAGGPYGDPNRYEGFCFFCPR